MLRKWHIKAMVQKVLAALPMGVSLNHWMQMHVTKGLVLRDEYFMDRLRHGAYHIKSIGDHLKDATTLELGTGWHPVVPISMFLCGAKEIHTVDLTRLVNREHLADTIRYFKMMEEKDGRISEAIPLISSRWQSLLQLLETESSFSEMMQTLGIRYHVGDARKLDMLADDSIDFIHSNNTFEHIYPEILKDILLEFKRLLGPGGMMCHFIDMSDHFAHFDTSITIYNFLKYSDRRWKMIDNNIQPQNRMRLVQYEELYKRINIDISSIDKWPYDMAQLDGIEVSDAFRHLTKEQLVVCHAYVHTKN